MSKILLFQYTINIHDTFPTFPQMENQQLGHKIKVSGQGCELGDPIYDEQENKISRAPIYILYKHQ